MFNKFIAFILPYFPKKFIWLFSKSYISGETIVDAMMVSKDLNKNKINVTLDVLGEFISSSVHEESSISILMKPLYEAALAVISLICCSAA